MHWLKLGQESGTIWHITSGEATLFPVSLPGQQNYLLQNRNRRFSAVNTVKQQWLWAGEAKTIRVCWAAELGIELVGLTILSIESSFVRCAIHLPFLRLLPCIEDSGSFFSLSATLHWRCGATRNREHKPRGPCKEHSIFWPPSIGFVTGFATSVTQSASILSFANPC